MSHSVDSDPTRKRILAAATLIFAHHGVAAATTRAITRAAKVNLAAVNYHFRRKEDLCLEILRSVHREVTTDRSSDLAGVEALGAGGQVQLAALVSALSRPLISRATDSSAAVRAATRFYARSLSEPNPALEGFVHDEVEPSLTPFLRGVRRLLPKLAPADFLWRFNFMVGSLHQTVSTLHRIEISTRGICRMEERDRVQAEFVRFATAGMTPAPA